MAKKFARVTLAVGTRGLVAGKLASCKSLGQVVDASFGLSTSDPAVEPLEGLVSVCASSRAMSLCTPNCIAVEICDFTNYKILAMRGVWWSTEFINSNCTSTIISPTRWVTAKEMPTSEESKNLETVTEYFTEYWGKANPDIVDKLCAKDYVMNYPMHGILYGREASKKMLRELKEAFPDLSFHTYQHPLIASGPYVVGRWIGGGTHSGTEFHDLAVGALDKPNTGKEMYFSGTTIFTLKDGLIVDETGEEGTLTALQNLGLVQQPNLGKEVEYLYD